jgi:hypothetical protein
VTAALRNTDEIAAIGAALVGWPVRSATPLQRGGNNRIYLLSGREERAALKFYPPQAEDPRDRLGQEFAALSFLCRNAIANVPRPLACDRARQCAAYTWIDGIKPDPGPAEVDALAEFFISLQALRSREGSHALAAASAGCFSPAMVAEQVEHRLARLSTAVAPGTDGADFLLRSLQPAARAAIDRLRAGSPAVGRAFAEPLARSLWTLSPSDFGFHNALRRPDGSLAFVDFEYFGWDDPAKAVADVMLHPGMGLPETLAQRYRSRIEAALAGDDREFSARLDLFFPSMVVLWCLILLNEFLPERWTRRALAGQKDAPAAVQARQLQKARDLLSRNFR